MRRLVRVRWCLALVALAPFALQAAADPRALDGAYRVPGDSPPAPLRDCAPKFIAGVGVGSTAHIVTGRDVMVIVHEANHVTRRVRIGGQHPDPLSPSALGDSIGWWDGDTLVVETIGVPSGRTVVERLRKVDDNRALEVTVDGRAMLARRQADPRFMEDVCEAPVAGTVAVAADATPPARATAVPPKRPAFDGIWQITQPVRSLRTTDGTVPPLRLDARKRHAERLELFKSGRAAEFNGSETCIPPGELRSAHGGQPFEIVQGQEAVFFGYTWNRMLRLAYLQPRAAGALRPAYYGNWTGRWDGNALVLDGSGFRDDAMLDATGLPHSDALHLTQRLTLARGGEELEIRTTVEDPKTYAHSWSTLQHYRRATVGAIAEGICTPAAAANTTPGRE
jgi:hypothetical protein